MHLKKKIAKKWFSVNKRYFLYIYIFIKRDFDSIKIKIGKAIKWYKRYAFTGIIEYIKKTEFSLIYFRVYLVTYSSLLLFSSPKDYQD